MKREDTQITLRLFWRILRDFGKIGETLHKFENNFFRQELMTGGTRLRALEKLEW